MALITPEALKYIDSYGIDSNELFMEDTVKGLDRLRKGEAKSMSDKSNKGKNDNEDNSNGFRYSDINIHDVSLVVVDESFHEAKLVFCRTKTAQIIRKEMKKEKKLQFNEMIQYIRQGKQSGSNGNQLCEKINMMNSVVDYDRFKFEDIIVEMKLNNHCMDRKNYDLRMNKLWLKNLESGKEYKLSVDLEQHMNNGIRAKAQEIKLKTKSQPYHENDDIIFTTGVVGNKRKTSILDTKYRFMGLVGCGFGSRLCNDSQSKAVEARGKDCKNSFVDVKYNRSVSIRAIFAQIACSRKSTKCALFVSIHGRWVFVSRLEHHRLNKIMLFGLETPKLRFQSKKGRITITALTIE